MPQVHSEASTPAYSAVCAQVPSPRFRNSVLRCSWGRSSIRPTSFGSAVCDGRCISRRRRSRLSMSTTKKSTSPSRSTSAKSTAIAALLVVRRASRGAARKVPVPSLSQK